MKLPVIVSHAFHARGMISTTPIHVGVSSFLTMHETVLNELVYMNYEPFFAARTISGTSKTRSPITSLRYASYI